MHDSWRRFEEGGLPRCRRGGLLRRELQQLEQPGVLRPQPGQLSLNRHWILSHKGHATGARRGRMALVSGRVLRCTVPIPLRPRYPGRRD